MLLMRGTGGSVQNGPWPMQLVVVMAVMEDPLPSSPFMGRCSDAHATGHAQGCQNSRQNGDYRLNDEFPSFFFHGILNFEFVNFEFPYRGGSLFG